MNVWSRSWLYRIWVVGGLFVVAGIVIKIGLDWKPRDEPPFLTIGIAVGVYLIGILVMQAVALGRDRPEDSEIVTPADTDGPPPTDTSGLRAALALPGADGSRGDRAMHEGWRMSVVQFIPLAAVAILLPLAGLLWVSGAVPGIWYPFGPTGIGIPYAAIPGLLIVAALVVLLPRTMRKARRISDDYMSVLGLSIVATPRSILLPRVGTDGVSHNLIGPTVFGGRRHGRQVLIEANSMDSAVRVSMHSRAYTLTGRDGRLTPDGAVPDNVSQVLATLPDDARWNRVSVTASTDGIEVHRRGASMKEGWLLDLWLAERLAATG